MLAGDEAGAERAYLDELDNPTSQAPGIVHFVDPGPGDADLLVLRALRLLGEADIIVHRPDESPAILEVARRDAARLAVAGDATGQLLERARAGRRIIRLSPHPAEEAALRQAGIATEHVPGVNPHR